MNDKDASTPKDESGQPLMHNSHNNNTAGGELSDVENPEYGDNGNTGRANIDETPTAPTQPERPQSLPTTLPHLDDHSVKPTKPKQDYSAFVQVTDEVNSKEDANNGVVPVEADEGENKAGR